MNAKQFGEQLVMTGDLDPIYIMLNNSSMGPDATARWCLAYWMFYHAGVASRIAEQEGESFWAMVWAAQVNKWPRGTERRHFRGANADNAIKYLEEHYPDPEDACAQLAGLNTWDELVDAAPIEPLSFALVASRAQQWVGFGPWIAFKIADMIDVCIGIPVAFPKDSSVWYDEPIKGGVFAWLDEMGHGVPYNDYHDGLSSMERRERVDEVIPHYLHWFKVNNTIGPDGRGVGIQELETIFCKYKSHLNGHYPIGKDTREILHALSDDRWGQLAQTLHTVLKDSTPKEHHG